MDPWSVYLVRWKRLWKWHSEEKIYWFCSFKLRFLTSHRGQQVQPTAVLAGMSTWVNTGAEPLGPSAISVDPGSTSKTLSFSGYVLCLISLHFVFLPSDYFLVSHSFSAFCKRSWLWQCDFTSWLQSWEAGGGWHCFVFTSAVLLPFVFLSLFYSQTNLLPPPCCYFLLYWIPFPPTPPPWLSIFHCLCSLFPP